MTVAAFAVVAGEGGERREHVEGRGCVVRADGPTGLRPCSPWRRTKSFAVGLGVHGVRRAVADYSGRTSARPLAALIEAESSTSPSGATARLRLEAERDVVQESITPVREAREPIDSENADPSRRAWKRSPTRPAAATAGRPNGVCRSGPRRWIAVGGWDVFACVVVLQNWRPAAAWRLRRVSA